MKSYEADLKNLLEREQRARLNNENENLDHYFKTPIIHREIHGDKVYVPLNLDRVWNRIN